MFTRVLDLAVLFLLAVAILMPRADVRVKLAFATGERDRVAELEARLAAKPDDVPVAMQLADLFMDGRRPDWALAVLRPALDGHPGDHRLHLRRSLALADHFEAAAAYQAARQAQALCEVGSTTKCGDGERSRIALLTSTLERVKDIDMRQDPNAAKERILEALRPTYVRKPPRRDAGRP